MPKKIVKQKTWLELLLYKIEKRIEFIVETIKSGV
jgi:hypothetical protein